VSYGWPLLGFTFTDHANVGLATDGDNFSFYTGSTLAFNLADSIKQFRVPADYIYSFSSATNNNESADTYLGRFSAGTMYTPGNFIVGNYSDDGSGLTLQAPSASFAAGQSFIGNDGSASFAAGQSFIGNDGSASFARGLSFIGNNGSASFAGGLSFIGNDGSASFANNSVQILSVTPPDDTGVGATSALVIGNNYDPSTNGMIYFDGNLCLYSGGGAQVGMSGGLLWGGGGAGYTGSLRNDGSMIVDMNGGGSLGPYSNGSLVWGYSALSQLTNDGSLSLVNGSAGFDSSGGIFCNNLVSPGTITPDHRIQIQIGGQLYEIPALLVP